MSGKIKFGVASPLPGQSVENLIRMTSKTERLGFDTIWFPDHVVFMAKTLTPEVWSVITAAGMKTKKIILGSIGDAHRIHPAICAHRLATVDHISRGRIFVCLGYGEKMNLDPYGIKWNKPLTRVREAIQIMRSLWKGGQVDFDGEIYKLSKAELRIRPFDDRSIPIYVAATAPKALKLAGECGEGWVTNAMPPKLYSDKLSKVREGMKSRDKTLPPLDKCLYIFLSIADDKDKAYVTLEPVKHALIWPELLKEAGYDIEVSEEYGDLQYTKIMPNDTDMIKRFREMGAKYYSRDIVEDFVISGSKADAIEKIERYIAAGVTHFIFRDFSPDRQASLRTLSKEILPYFRYNG
jgi:alkanesulfonate monooxygenase SsuD/methylene tetrahydromethanopterin reductase-like flavin-dependent oxidoreductase (luciferase family)